MTMISFVACYISSSNDKTLPQKRAAIIAIECSLISLKGFRMLPRPGASAGGDSELNLGGLRKTSRGKKEMKATDGASFACVSQSGTR